MSLPGDKINNCKREARVTSNLTHIDVLVIAFFVMLGLLVARSVIHQMLKPLDSSNQDALPRVIHSTQNCDILRGVYKGEIYYVSDCTRDRLSQVGPLPIVPIITP